MMKIIYSGVHKVNPAFVDKNTRKLGKQGPGQIDKK